MKQGVHPTYHKEITVTCACGNTFTTGSTDEALQVEICAACHPFYSGTAKIVDTAGRVDKFKARLAKAEEYKKTTPAPTKKGELIDAESNEEKEQTHEEPNDR